MPRLPEDRSDSASSRRGGPVPLSLRARLVLLVTLSVVPLLIFSLAIEYRNYREDSANAGRRTLDLARSMSLTVAQELRAEVAAIQTLALSAALEAGDIAAFRHRADGLVAHH